MSLYLTLLSISQFILISCNTAQISTFQNSQIPPSHVRVQGEIVEILPKKSDQGKCQEYKCWAKIKIEKIIGYGSGFSESISKQDTVEAHFTFTLNPTKNIFPELTNNLPGLRMNERFVADLKLKLSPLQTQQVRTYQIDNYQIMN